MVRRATLSVGNKLCPIKLSVRAGEMIQYIKYLPKKYKEWSSDPQHLNPKNKKQLRDPGGKQAS